MTLPTMGAVSIPGPEAKSNMQISYNQAILALARDGLAALAASSAIGPKATEAQKSHFLCNFMATALKEKRYPKLIANELTLWVRQGRSLGANAGLRQLLERISHQYGQITDVSTGLGHRLEQLLAKAKEQGFLVFTDTVVDGKLKLDADGVPSIVISHDAYSSQLKDGELLGPLTLYVRADEGLLAQMALDCGLLLSAGDKKASLIKHHKSYRLFPQNQLPCLALLTK
nr:DUF2913 family protein [Shewanella sedimentimangrovi]